MKQIFYAVLVTGVAALFMYLLQKPLGGLPAIGSLLDPINGVYHLARNANHSQEIHGQLPGLTGAVEVVRDERGVPHIFAQHDLDAVSALGYAVAQDRLFQLDFIPRVAAGRLSEILGESMVDTDRFLRETGMEWGASRNYHRIVEEGGIELDLLRAYVRGVNAYINSMQSKDLPLEFRLMGHQPELYTEKHVLRILQYMTFDLTYRSNDHVYSILWERLGQESFEELFPSHSNLFVPIIPEKGGQIPPQERRQIYQTPRLASLPAQLSEKHGNFVSSLEHSFFEGYIDGKGSNNWAVGPTHSETGGAILAGDMHLSLWLPSIWYEAHLVTPDMNTYGVTIPGAPLPVEAYNDYLGWAFTNSGTDQIDYLSLELDETGSKYLFEGEYKTFESVVDTIFVKGAEPVIENRMYAHWGPALVDEDQAMALQWVAHEESTTMKALWYMNRASSMAEFQKALRDWDTPMQNIIYGDVDGNISIRTTGYMPIRKIGHGIGLLNGASSESEWVSRIPFEELPYSYNPSTGYLTSTNQQPADSLYPYYQGYDWGPGYRSLRIDALLSGKNKHSVADIKRYQSDVYVVQRDLFVPLFDEVTGLSEKASELSLILKHWEGTSDIDRIEPLIFDIFLEHLNALTWDEDVFIGSRKPKEDRLYALLTGDLSSKWLDRTTTQEVENAQTILRTALEYTVETLEGQYGWDKSKWVWGEHHNIVFKHYTRSDALKALWRGPYAYPGFAQTLSPAADRETTHSASWRMVVDFSTPTPTGFGVYPGGQSGNPFSDNYDKHIQHYLDFKYFVLKKPRHATEISPQDVSSVLILESADAR